MCDYWSRCPVFFAVVHGYTEILEFNFLSCVHEISLPNYHISLPLPVKLIACGLPILAYAVCIIHWETLASLDSVDKPRMKSFWLVHKRMFYIRTNLRILQHSNIECNIQMFILYNKMMHFGDLWFLLLALAMNLWLSPNKHIKIMYFVYMP